MLHVRAFPAARASLTCGRLLLLALLCFSACSASVTGIQPLTFVVPIDTRLFAEDATLDVRLWNAAQLAVLEKHGGCATVIDAATGTVQVRCPDSVQSEEVKPEVLRFQLSAAGDRLQIPSRTIRPGERFRILISGPSRDRCNVTLADLTASADAAETLLTDLDWETTTRACP